MKPHKKDLSDIVRSISASVMARHDGGGHAVRSMLYHMPPSQLYLAGVRERVVGQLNGFEAFWIATLVWVLL